MRTPTLPRAGSRSVLTGDVPNWAPTPGRHTTVEYDVPEAVSVRPAWGMSRRASEIAVANKAGVGPNVDVALIPGGAWTLRPMQYGMRFGLIDMQGFTIIGLETLIAIAIIQEKRVQKIPPLPGITIAPDQATEASPYLQKRVPAGENWSAELAGDAASYAKPTLPSEDVKVRRIAVGTRTHPANEGFCIRFWLPAAVAQTHDVILSYYFGGDTDVDPATGPGGKVFKGGAFCATFFGDGICELREYGTAATGTAREWVKVMQFRYSAVGKVSQDVHSVYFMPHRKGMSIFAESSDTATDMGKISHGPTLVTRNVVNTALYTTNKSVVGYELKKEMTGPGPVRLDEREDLRPIRQMSILAYHESGVLEDHNFVIPFPLPDGTPIKVTLDKYEPPGTQVAVQLYESESGAALGTNADGDFLALAGKNNYFARFAFSTSNALNGTLKRGTPFLYGYYVNVSGWRQERGTEPFSGGVVTSVSITGPTRDPTTETAHLVVEDVYNQVPALRYKGRIHTRIKTTYDPADASKECILFEGELTKATALRKGRTGMTVAHEEWRQYDCPMVSMWARLADQISFGALQLLSTDPDAPTLINGEHFPSTITRIIRILLTDGLGLPDDMVDVPEVPLRAWPGTGDKKEYELQPTASIVDWIMRMIKDYLGHFLIWDANAGERGMWRLRPPALPSAAPLWSFVGDHPGSHKAAVAPQSYPARTSPYYHYTSYVRPPEANYVIVSSVGDLLPDKSGSTGVTQFAVNPRSVSIDPSHPTATDPFHPDFLGRFVPLVYYQPNLTGPNKDVSQSVGFLCRRLYEQVAHAQKWVRISTPLVLIDDPTDAFLVAGKGRRPLRYYDPINIEGELFFVNSIQMDIRKDHVQTQVMECLAAQNTSLV